MASKTKNYGLNKHDPTDFYNVEARNENWDKIDETLAAADPTKVTTKAAPADGDGVMIADSADGGKAKRLLWSSVKAALEQVFGDVRTAVSKHIADKSNPHGVTAAQIGAATSADLKAHTDSKNNPHGVTAGQIGAAIGTKILSDDDDLNTLYVSGMYRVSGSTKNCPYAYGQVLVIGGGGDTVAQMCFPFSGDECKVRWGNPSPLGAGSWADWTNLVTGRTIANQSVNSAKYAGTRYWNSYNLKDEKLNWSEETPTEQGTICWLYQ